MANLRALSRSFAAGEITPELFGRIDLSTFQTGLALCRNFVTLPHGPAQSRSGFEFVRETKDSTQACRVIPFTFSSSQTMVLEFGNFYVRFHTQGATLLEGAKVITGVSAGTITSAAHGFANGDWVVLAGIVGPSALNGRTAIVAGATTDTFTLTDMAGVAISTAGMPVYVIGGTASRIYTIATPYAAADLFGIRYVQSADVLSLVHTNYPPAELRRLGATSWQFANVVFNPVLAPPTGIAAVATAGTGTPNNIAFSYVVTALATTTLEESTQSAAAGCTNDLTLPTALNTITFAARSGAVRYNVYKQSNGLYGYIGQTDGLTFVDKNITSDTTRTPPMATTALQSAGNYPGAVSYAQQRRVFASTLTQPQNMWMTRTATENNLTASIPSRDDDAITFRIAARESNRIQHIVPMASIILLTDSAEWLLADGTNGVLTPSTVSAKPQTYVGAAPATPQVVDYSLIYAANRGGHVREMTYQWQNSGYISQDISLMAPHLFDYQTVLDMAYMRSPYPIIWCVSSNGTLLGLTYSPRQQVTAWHHHDTDGVFESIAVVVEGTEDALYAVIRRTVNGRSVRYIERMHTRKMAVLADAFFVDAGATYRGAVTTSLTGLYHLEGKTVSILADGAVMPQAVVTGGAITLQQAASVVTVGLQITADLETLPFSAEMPAFGQGRVKNVNRAWLRVKDTSGVYIGPTVDDLVQYKQRTTEPYGSPPKMITGVIEIEPRNGWTDDAQIFVRQVDPLPVTVASIVIEAAIGG
jgi:hypothetical protein